MTCKHFELIAAVLRYDMDNVHLYPDTEIRIAACSNRAKRMAKALSTTNNAFDKARFIAACGVRT